VNARVWQAIDIDKNGLEFRVWKKWSKKGGRLGTLLVSNGGLRWRPGNGKYLRRRTWEQVAELLSK
jgi:hypothetical protein